MKDNFIDEVGVDFECPKCKWAGNNPTLKDTERWRPGIGKDYYIGAYCPVCDAEIDEPEND